MAIRWKDDERKLVAAKLASLLMTGWVDRTQAAREAIKVLPLERRREIPGYATIRPILDDLVEAELERLRKLPLAQRVESPAKPAASTTPAPAVQPAATAPTVMSSVEDALVEAVKRVVIRVVFDPEIRNAIVSALGVSHEYAVPMPRHNPAPAVVTVGQRLPRVLVAGLIAQQITEVRAIYTGRLDLRFWTTDQKVSDLPGMAQGCDVVVGCVGFMPHVADKAIQKTGVKYLRNSNGVATVRRLLDAEFGFEPAAHAG